MEKEKKMEKEMVNHPSHYLKKGRIECIELLDGLTRGYKGVAAFDIGQFKYLYRAGEKEEEGLSIYEKAAQDVDKAIWYMKDFANRGSYMIPEDKGYNKLEIHLIEEEFAFGKPEKIQETIKKCVHLAYSIQRKETANEIIRLLEIIKNWYLDND